MDFDLLSFLLGKSTGSGGGGGSAALGPKTIRQNGVYRASSDNLDGFNAVTVEVPHTYAAADEGKVVSNGALVAQTSRTITENGTYDTTTNDEVVVNVSGGGYTADEFAKGTAPVGNIVLTGTTLRNYLFADCKNITGVSAPNATNINTYCFRGCDGIRVMRFDSLQTLAANGNNFSSMETGRQGIIVLPALTELGSRNFQRGHLGVVDIGPNLTGSIGTDSFYTNAPQTHWPIVNTLILRSSTLITAPAADAISGLKDVYVPSALISEYEEAAYWSNKVANASYPVTFHAIEGSQYEEYWADGTPITA